jgi:iron(III) transport system substrate-binding protein
MIHASVKRFPWILVFCFSLFFCGVVPLAAFADPKVIEAAKKEGELAWWSTIAQDQSQKLVDEFMKRYPFIKANYWRSGSVGLHNKIMIEARAGRSSWDVVSQTTPEFIYELKQKKIITAYNSPERSHFSPDLKDSDGYWTGTYALPTGLGFNTQQVKRKMRPRATRTYSTPGGRVEKSLSMTKITNCWSVLSKRGEKMRP